MDRLHAPKCVAWLAFVAFSATTLTACSSCSIDGQYLFAGTVISGNCPKLESAMTVGPAIAGASGDYFVQLANLTGGCPATSDGACRLQVNCQGTVADATDPNNNVASVQFSLTMSSGGFTGTATLSVPPSASFSGCSGTESLGGTRD